jgi:hypothetical protein
MTKHNYGWARLALGLGLLLNALAVGAGQPRLEPLLQGRWAGSAYDVEVVGNRAYVTRGYPGWSILDVSNPASPVRLGGYDAGWAWGVAVSGTVAYVADRDAGLQIIDVSNPASPVRLGGYDTSGTAWGVAVSGSIAYVADRDAGLQIIDVSNPASPVRLGGYDTSGDAYGVAVAGNRIFVADGPQGLKIFCTLPNVQCMMRVDDGTVGTPFTIEAATNLTEPVGWTALLTTNPAALPFEFTDFDVRIATYPQKFYRARQP